MSDPSRKPSGVLAATLLILFGVVLFIVLAWSSHASLRGVDAATDARSRSRTGLLLAAEVMSALKDIETGQRGYVLTGDEHYLGPYERGMRSLDKSFEALRSTLAGQPEARLETLWPLIDRRVALAERNIADRRNLPEEDSRWKQRLDEGRDTMDRIRERFAAIEAMLRAEIEVRDRSLSELRARALLLNVLLPAIGGALILAAWVLLQRERRRRLEAEAALIAANARLEDTVAQRTAELQTALGEIEAFALGLDRGIEEERRRLAREVNDQLGQLLTALKMMVHRALQGAPGREQDWPQIETVLGEGIAIVRRISAALRPPLLDDLGLEAALGLAGRQFAERTGLACEVALADADRLSADQSNQLYRIAQEALTNVARHAQAARVRIEGAAVDGRYRLVVEDDGVGMAQQARSSLGLLSMRERAALAGGELRIGSGAGGGVRIEARVPFAAVEEDGG